MTGLYEKSKGQVLINQLDLEENLDIIRKSTGFCCQKDVLYDELSVQEHLKFIATIKGVKSHDMNKEINFILAKVIFISTLFIFK